MKLDNNKKPLTKKEVNKLCWHFNANYCRCGNFENWHGTTYGWSLIPMFEKYYGVGTKEFSEGVVRNCDFHNNEPVTANIVQGIVLGMEEERALGKDVDPEVIRSTKAALMGPCAGIGDSLVQATFVPLMLSLAISMTGSEGAYTPVGCIFYLIAVPVLLSLYAHALFVKGHSMGRDAMSLIAGPAVKTIQQTIQMFGIILVGALSANYCKPQTILSFVPAPGADATSIQDILDGIFPNILGLGLVLLCYWLMAKKKVSIMKMILILMAATILLAYANIL